MPPFIMGGLESVHGISLLKRINQERGINVFPKILDLPWKGQVRHIPRKHAESGTKVQHSFILIKHKQKKQETIGKKQEQELGKARNYGMGKNMSIT